MPIRKISMIAVAAALLLWSCSDNNEQEKEKGKIETMTEQAGQEAVRAIKTPREKADTAADAASQRAKEMNEQKEQ